MYKNIQDRIWSSTELPSLPIVVMKLIEMHNGCNSDIQEIIDLIKTDPALSVRVLKAAASPFYGIKREIRSIESAVMLLGPPAILALSLSFSLVDKSMVDSAVGMHYRDLWLRKVVQASAAELLAECFKSCDGSELFVSGLLCDVGQLAMLKTIDEEYTKVLSQASDTSTHLCRLESEIADINHIEVGGRLLCEWHLSESMQCCTTYHHASIDQIRSLESEHHELIQAVAIAAAAGEIVVHPTAESQKRFEELTTEFCGFSDADRSEYMKRVLERSNEAGELLEISTSRLPTISELMTQANLKLTEIALMSQMRAHRTATQRMELEVQNDILECENELLKTSLTMDSLTGIHNRAYFSDYLETELARAARKRTHVGVLFCDIDHFKWLNDHCGHQFGDEALVAIAHILRDASRASDTVARYGGEEFVILAADSEIEGLEIIGEQIRASVEALELKHDGEDIPVTISVGGAICIPNRNDSEIGRVLLREADFAMYESKNSGRNQVRIRTISNNPLSRIAP